MRPTGPESWGPTSGAPPPATRAFYESAALAVPGITTVQVVPRASGAGTVAVFAWGEGAAPSAAVLEELEADLQAQREIGVTVTVAAATPLPVNVSANVRPRAGADFAAVKTAVEDALAQWFAGLGWPALSPWRT